MNKRLYDWEKLFAAGRFKLRRGRHYACSQAAIVQQIRNAASITGVNETKMVHVCDTGDGVDVFLEDKQLCQK